MNKILLWSVADYPLFFVFWNLFLAAIPLWIAGYLYQNRFKITDLRFVILFVIWFFFFPNAPYLFTEVRHLLDFCPPSRYEVCWQGLWQIPFFFTYSVAGLPFFYVALKKMSVVLSRFKKCLIHFPLFMIPMTSIGLLFGTVDRFNSWEVVTNPFSLLRTAAGYFTDVEKFTGFISFTICLYLIYYGVGYFAAVFSDE